MDFLTQRLRGIGAALLAAASLSAAPVNAAKTECENKADDLTILISNHTNEEKRFNEIDNRIFQLNKAVTECKKEEKACPVDIIKLKDYTQQRIEKQVSLKTILARINNEISSSIDQCQDTKAWRDLTAKYPTFFPPQPK